MPTNGLVRVGTLMGDPSKPYGKASQCPECGAEAELLTTPEKKNREGEVVEGGRKYYQLRCTCQKRKIAASAKATFDDAYRNWAAAQRVISDLERVPEKERDMGMWNEAWGRARRSAATCKEFSESFGFPMSSVLVTWGQRYIGAAWGE